MARFKRPLATVLTVALALGTTPAMGGVPVAAAQSSQSSSLDWLGPMLSSLGDTARTGSSGSSIREVRPHALRSDAPLPDKPGKLFASEPVGRADVKRILYTTTNERGQIVPVSGAVYEPTRSVDGVKGTVVLAPGTRGMGDRCAPSASAALLGRVEGSSVNVNYEAPIAQRLAREGYRVVVTDYIGMGTPGIHTYLNRIDQGHAVIDAGRAATAEGEKVFYYGYSQGGGATAAAGELQPAYAPEVNLVGIFAGAPPADPLTMLEQGHPKTLEGVASFVIASYAYSYPEFRLAIADYATPAAFRYLFTVANSCLAETTLSSAPLEQFTGGGSNMVDIARTDPRIRGALERNRLGNAPVRAPILIVQSPQDNVVPFQQGKQLAEDYARLGSPVEFRAIELDAAQIRAGLGHIGPAITQSQDVIRWMNQRFGAG